LAGGTLEGTGPNKMGTTSGMCRDLNFNSITDNASVSPGTQHLEMGGPNKLNDRSSPLSNMVDTSADTSMMEVPGGTLESSGANG